VGGGAAAQRFAGQQDQPVDGEEDGCGQRFGEQGAEGVFQGQSGDADRDGGDDQQPGQAFVGVGGDESARGDAGPDGASEPAVIRTQSVRKKMIRASAVATCRATMTADKGWFRWSRWPIG